MNEPRQLPFTPSGWNPAKPKESFRTFAQNIHEQAKKVLLQDKDHAEMLFFVPLDGRGHIVLWQGKDKDQQAEWVRKHLSDHYVYGIIHVCEAWVRIADGPKDHILNQVIDGEMRVSELRPEDRIDALTVMAQSREGYDHAWIDEIISDKAAGIVQLGRCKEFDDLEGRFGKLFG